MQKKPKDKSTSKRPSPKTVAAFFCTVIAVFAVYRIVVVELSVNWFFWVYYGMTLVAGVFYVLYNFGFSRHSLTPEILPDTWTEEEKERFLVEGKRRERRSRPVLFCLIGVAFTFLYDALSLYAPRWFSAIEKAVSSWFT